MSQIKLAMSTCDDPKNRTQMTGSAGYVTVFMLKRHKYLANLMCIPALSGMTKFFFPSRENVTTLNLELSKRQSSFSSKNESYISSEIILFIIGRVSSTFIKDKGKPKT